VQISGGQGGMLKLLVHRETQKLLALHIIGQSATELVHIGQAIIDHGEPSSICATPCSTIRLWPKPTKPRR
jgi:pyruvate/2-oxoglutarate dehydrogenase complex dihydrolipoamide dehydrogenase (E3) component